MLRDGGDATIAALAAVLPRALDAAETLASEHGIEATVVDVRSLVPLDCRSAPTGWFMAPLGICARIYLRG